MLSIRQLLVSSLYLVVLTTKIRPSTCLGLRNLRHRPSPSRMDLRIQKWDSMGKITLLYSRKFNDDNDGESNRNTDDKKPIATTPVSPEVSLLMDPGLWASDFLALILASQLIGLLNVLNSPEFVANGGWFQPIPAVPSTLDDLVQRISVFGVTWAIASASVVFFANTKALGKISSEDSDTFIILKKNFQTLAVFGVLLFLGNGILPGLGDANGNIDGNPWLEVLRNCYYVGLSTSGLRFLYGRYFLLS